MTSEDKVTYCRICEPLCGLVATVEDGELVKLRPDPRPPALAGLRLSQGHRDDRGAERPRPRPAPAASARADGELRAGHLGRGARRHRRAAEARRRRADGGDAVGWYMGNPGAFSYSHPLWVKGFLDALGSPHFYTAGSQDVNNRFAASWLLYGSPFLLPIPDLARTDLLLMRRRQPAGLPRQRHHRAPDQGRAARRSPQRGGRVVVVDPRRSETARRSSTSPVRPDADAWLLLSLLARDLRRGTRGRARRSRAVDGVRRRCASSRAGHPPEETEAPHRRRRARRAPLARDLAAAPSRRGVRPHRLVPGPPRHARRLPARRAQPRHRQPRPRGRGDVRRSADRLRAARRDASALGDLRQAALARRRLARRARLAARRR